MKRIVLLLLLLVSLLSGCTVKEKDVLTVFAAGSLMQPFQELEAAFEAENPDIDLQLEFHGSIQVIRRVTDIHQAIDLVATADQSLLPLLMYATKNPETGEPYANWHLSMATNTITIAYTPKSKYAEEINAHNWYEILSREDVRVGISDPRFDAMGYRTFMTFALASDFYTDPAIFGNFVHGQFKHPIKLERDGEKVTIIIPDLVETREDSHLVVRGSSIALNALLESGEIDYAFEYLSVANQLGFDSVRLPPEFGLNDPKLEDYYNRATVKLDFQRFASVEPVFTAEQIRYGLTVPTNALRPDLAILFIKFLYGKQGQQIMEKNWQPLFVPARIDQPENLPPELSEFFGL